MYLKFPFIIVAFLTFTLKGLAQNPESGNTLLARFDTFRSRTLQEKVFVHTDKSFYLAGEVLWYKIYDVEGYVHRPLDVSKVAYVEILDKDNRFVLQGKTGLEKAEGAGSFYLPLSLSSGNYKLRAYTSWMKNFGPDYFFEEPITIVNTLKSLPVSPRDTTPDYHVSFFPEGGHLVKGIRSRVAFQVTDQRGRGVSCKGMVVDDHKDTLVSFSTLRSGIGSFLFTPADEKPCQSVLQLPDGQLLTAGLPVADRQGMVMSVTEDRPDRLAITVHSRGISSGEVYLFAQAGQTVRTAVKRTLVNDSTVFLVDRHALGEGITQFTLFDQRLQPVCERLYFRRPSRQLSIDVTTDQQLYGIRKMVRLDISAREEKGDPLTASLSLAVYRLDPLQSVPEINIYNYLWLLSDLKGTVESPETYFSSQGEEADRALDNLMLTHGWRKFRWDDILKGEEPVFIYPPEYVGQLITGRLTDMHTGQPLRDRVGYLSVPGSQFRFSDAITDSAGKLTFDVKDFYGPGGFIIHSGLAADSPCKVEIFSPFSESWSDRRLSPFALSPDRHGGDKDALTDLSIAMQVQNIYSGDSLQRFWPPAQDSLHFFRHPDHTYKLDDYTRFTTMEEVLREYVREINVNHSYGRLHVKMLNEPLREVFDDNEDLVLLDGVPVPDDKIFSYDPLKVKRLDVISKQYFLGPSAFNGIASFTTYKGDYDGFELDPHSLLIDYEGLQLRREFYSPAYVPESQVTSRRPDFRNLLFWAPDIHTRPDGKKGYDFYTSDLPGRYVAVIEGIADNGTAGVSYHYFDVK